MASTEPERPSFSKQLSDGLTSFAHEFDEQVNKGRNFVRGKYQKFEVICPECAKTLIPPDATKFPTFECQSCHTLLFTPSNLMKTDFFINSFVKDVTAQIQNSFKGGEFQRVSITVPENVRGADVITVNYLNKLFNVEVPPGLKSGDKFIAELDISGTETYVRRFIAKRVEKGSSVEKTGKDKLFKEENNIKEV